MKYSIFLFVIFVISSCVEKKTITEKENIMISKLTEIKNEDKFAEGSNNIKGYTGCKNQEEKEAYSNNINTLIDELINLIIQKDNQKQFLELINKHIQIAEELQEHYKVETEESDMQYIYFERIKEICMEN